MRLLNIFLWSLLTACCLWTCLTTQTALWIPLHHPRQQTQKDKQKPLQRYLNLQQTNNNENSNNLLSFQINATISMQYEFLSLMLSSQYQFGHRKMDKDLQSFIGKKFPFYTLKEESSDVRHVLIYCHLFLSPDFICCAGNRFSVLLVDLQMAF